MTTRTFLALAGGVTLTAALSFGCRNAGSTNPPSTDRLVAQRSAGVDGPAGDSAPARIITDEPESYSATLRLTAEAVGERAVALPNLEAEVARRGRDRRVSFRLPDGEQVVYLSRGGTRYVLLPDRERYAEVTSREAGLDLPRLLMPDRLVEYLRRQRGYARAGEEELGGRTVVKYVVAGEVRPGTHAGDINAENAESAIYVDKLTGLPLRAAFVTEAAGGARGVKVLAEMRNVRTGADPALFAVPRRMKQVGPEEVREQLDSFVNTAARLAGPLLNQVSDEAATSASAGR